MYLSLRICWEICGKGCVLLAHRAGWKDETDVTPNEGRKEVRLEMLRGRHNFPEDILPLTQELVYVTQGEITWDIHNQAGLNCALDPCLLLAPFKIVRPNKQNC